MENRFVRYGLKENPFPEVAIANRNSPGPFISFDEDFMSKLSFLIESSIDQKAWGGTPLVGTVGSGKSRLLFEIFKKYKDSKEVKFIFIENPGLSLKNLYSAIIEDVLKDSSVFSFLFRRYEAPLLEIVQKSPQKELVYPSKPVIDL